MQEPHGMHIILYIYIQYVCVYTCILYTYTRPTWENHGFPEDPLQSSHGAGGARQQLIASSSAIFDAVAPRILEQCWLVGLSRSK